MRTHQERLLFSPSDLNTFFESPFASWMDRAHFERPGTFTPDEAGEDLALIAKMGIAHERRYLESLGATTKVWEPAATLTKPAEKLAECLETTREALRAGHPIVYQGALAAGEFAGYTDFLRRVERPSKLGAFSYEVEDTKLARKPKPYFMLQLCAYAKMLEELQGVRPEFVYIVNGEGKRLAFRTDDYFFYFRALERRFLEQHRTFNADSQPTPGAGCDHGRWQSHADALLERMDHLCRVANITKHQIKRLAGAAINTLSELATTKVERVPKMDGKIFKRLCDQARLQEASVGQDVPLWELVPADPDTVRYGLAQLPPVSPMDVYFDMEGYPLVEGGLEYLFGATYIESGKPKFKEFWAHDRAQEKRAFEGFVDWVYARFLEDPSMHVFHYAAYEVTALRRLMGSHGTREAEVDALLTAEVFVDLYRVVLQSIRIGEPKYSIKNVERLYRAKRAGDVATAAQSVVEYARWMENPDGASWEASPVLKGIRDYNIEDCDSTWELREWLGKRQAEAGIAYAPPLAEEEKPKTEKSEKAALKRKEARDLGASLLAAIPMDRSADPEHWRIQELLAHLIEFHRREAKPALWRLQDWAKQTPMELVEDGQCLGDCRRTAKVPWKVERSYAYEYAFDANQDTKLAAGSKAIIAGTRKAKEIVTLDRERGLVEIKSTEKDPLPALLSLVPSELVPTDSIADSIARVAKAWKANGTLPPALASFLHRTAPIVHGVRPGDPLLGGAAVSVEAITKIVAGLKDCTVAVQGPPGAGKTYVGSAVIAELALRGLRVGIASNSHSAVENLMKAVAERLGAKSAGLNIVKVNKERDEAFFANKTFTWAESIKDVVFAGDEAANIVGGTAWAFSAPEAEGMFDYLFVDEAGQVSIANLVGMAPSAKNIVLLGDQMQLGQPMQGSHPGESGQSTLEYLLQEHRTIPAHLGIFLETTWRMHPSVCKFISGAIYDDKLMPEPGTAKRMVKGWDHEAGIVFMPVLHEGNAQASDEEVAKVCALFEALQGKELQGTEDDRPRKLTADDVLVVAPYNAQVRAVRAKRADAKAGSVDKFQGQEAPVVIVSMCASSGESSPRGMDFLLDPNRLNVALSRAQSLAIVVASPAIAETRVTSVAQMKLVNLFCRIVEEGSATS